MNVTSVMVVPKPQSGYFLIRLGEEHVYLYPYIRRCCVHLINLVNLLQDSELYETAVLGREVAFSKAKST